MIPSFASSEPADDRSTELEGLVSHSDDRRLQTEAIARTSVMLSSLRNKMPGFAPSKPADDKSTELEGLVSHADNWRLQLKAELRTMVRFGPVYAQGIYKETEANEKAKDSAWRHILETSGESEDFTYLAAVANVERDALEIYNKETVDLMNGRRDEFRKMMVRDGCFFLQLALHILGAGHELLGYDKQNVYFGEGSKYPYSLIPDMFFVGNQIPYVVIKALMDQTFFGDVIGRWKLQRPYEADPLKLALYQTVMEPHMRKKVGPEHVRDPRHHQPPPANILVALHNLLLGFGEDDLKSMYYEMGVFDVDLETGDPEDSTVKIPSAGRLLASGINLIKSKTGIGNIRFKNFGYSARLYISPLLIHSHTEQLLASLASYETASFDNSQREVTAYLRFIRDLTPTYNDFRILERRGIISFRDRDVRRSFNRRLHDIVSIHKPIFTPKFNEISQKIKEYEVVPWRPISFVFSIACGILTFIIAVLTIVQTVIAILSYNKGSS